MTCAQINAFHETTQITSFSRISGIMRICPPQKRVAGASEKCKKHEVFYFETILGLIRGRTQECNNRPIYCENYIL